MTCSCADGWCQVGDADADRAVERVTIPAVDDPHRAEVEREHGRLWRAARAAVYPCRTCQPAAFMRWTRGHYRAGHECGECADLRTSRKAREEFTGLATSAIASPDVTRKDYI